MLSRIKGFQRKLRVLCDILHQGVGIRLLLVGFLVHTHKPVKAEFRRRHCESMPLRVDLHGGRLILRRSHATRRKTFPDQLVQAELVTAQGLFQIRGCAADVRRPDRLVRILYLLVLLLLRHDLGCILIPVIPGDILPGRCHRLVGDPGGVCSQIGDDADRPLPFQLHALVELLCQAHRLLRREIERLARLLLQCRCGERQRCLLDALALLDILHFKAGTLEIFQDFVHLLLGRDLCLFVSHAIVLGNQRLFFALDLERRVERPVLFRDKCIDLILPVTDDAQRHRLHPARAQPSLDLCPQKRRDAVAHHPVQHAPRLLRIHETHIDLPRILEGFLHRIPGDLVERNAVHLFVLQLQGDIQMPRDRLPLAVRVRREVDLVSLFDFLPELCQYVALAAYRYIFRFIVIVRIKSQLALWHITHMAVACHNLIICT